MIELIATGIGCFLFGFFTCAALTAGKVDEAQSDACLWEESSDQHREAHTRASSGLNLARVRIDRLKDIASSQQSVKSGRIIAVLSGEGV